MFVSKAKNYPKVEHLKGSSLGQATALHGNMRLGWKGWPGTNTLVAIV